MSDSHGTGEVLPNETYINTAGVAVWVIGSVLLLPFLLLGVYSYFQVVSQEMMRERIGAVPTVELNEARATWDAELNSSGIVDKEANRYRTPGDKAKSRYSADHKRLLAEEKLRGEAAAAAEAEMEGAEMEGNRAFDGEGVKDPTLIERVIDKVRGE